MEVNQTENRIPFGFFVEGNIYDATAAVLFLYFSKEETEFLDIYVCIVSASMIGC